MAEPARGSTPSSVAGRIARLRVPLGFVVAAVVFGLATPTRATLAVGVPIALVGEALRFWAAGHLRKSREVTTSGPYRFIAHPLYAGSTIMGLGVAVAAGRGWVVAIVLAYLVATFLAAIRYEEAFLRERFGARYDDYRRDPRQVASATRFSVAQALANREHRAVLGFIVAVLLLVWKATYNRTL